MEIEIWWIGKTTDSYLNQGLSIYLKKLNHYVHVNVREFKEAKGLKNIQVIKQHEEQAILKAIQTPGILPVLLDETGEINSSSEFASWVENNLHTHNRKLCFIIGGAYGFSDEIKKQVATKLSLSKMTFTHQMIRLIFLEQLFRAFTIINNIPYHNE